MNIYITVPWKGWSKEAPSYRERRIMFRKCGKKCFLGPASQFSYPICKKKTCKISRKGLYAAYVRARQYKKTKIATQAKRLLH